MRAWIPLAVVALLPTCAAAYPVAVEADAFSRAHSWLRDRTRVDGCIGAEPTGSCTHSTTRDSIIAISATGVDPGTWSAPTPVDYLREAHVQLENEAGGCPACAWAKTIVALARAGEDPRRFGGVDYVGRLDAYFDGVQMGDARQVNDDAWSLFGYASVDEEGSAKVASVREFLHARQNPTDGGWAWSLGASDAWGTATILLALLETGTPVGDESVDRAVGFLRTQVGSSGLVLQDGFDSAESTAITLQAVRRAGVDATSPEWTVDGRNPVAALLALQASDGSFSHNADGGSRFLATTQALPALRGVPYPFRPPTVDLARTPINATAGNAIELRALESDPDGVIQSRRWQVDSDDRAVIGPLLVLNFTDPGRHQVRLTSTDDDGVARSVVQEINVDSAHSPPPSAGTSVPSVPPARGVEASAPPASVPSASWILSLASVPLLRRR